MRLSLRAVGLACLLGLAGPLMPGGGAPAQERPEALDPDRPVALVADRVEYDSARGMLTASGNVEVFYGARTLTADRIVYDDRTERIRAEGDIVLRDGTGATVYASLADLDAELRDGLVRGAQSVLAEEVKLSALEARRVEDRYNVLSKAVYSPCRVCAEDPTPLWRIRARKVIHDEEARIVHYENATFDVFGVPVFWVPYFSHPDPTVERATGFLVPDLRSSSNYGFAVKTPFHWAIDESQDLTITPFVTSEEGVLGELEYRRAFENGSLSLAGSIASDDRPGSEGGVRGHLDTDGRFFLGPRGEWGWDVKVASDDAYLDFFDFSNEDRLTSELYAERYGPRWYVDARGFRFQSLRDDEPAGQIPLALPVVDARYELAEEMFSGTLGAFAASQGLVRNNGTDTGRVTLGVDWRREEVLPVGLALTGFAEVRGDLFFKGDDKTPGAPDGVEARLAPLAGVRARYPLVAGEPGGATHVLEPVVQGIVAPFGGNGPEFPNEDSLITEFDETNLFDRSRFSGYDGFEEGPRLDLGLRYERIAMSGLRFDAAVGRSLRLREADEFSEGSGLADAVSDWVGSWSASYDPYVTVRQRLRIEDDGEVTRNNASVGLSLGPVSLRGEYVFLEQDPTIDATEDREEVNASARLRIDENWSVRGFLRRDLEKGEFVNLGTGARFANECCAVDLFIQRRFTDRENVPADTSFGLRVELFTLGASRPGTTLIDQ
jgi:LPS-assembly protein